MPLGLLTSSIVQDKKVAQSHTRWKQVVCVTATRHDEETAVAQGNFEARVCIMLTLQKQDIDYSKYLSLLNVLQSTSLNVTIGGQ